MLCPDSLHASTFEPLYFKYVLPAGSCSSVCSSAHFDLITHEILHLQYIGFHAGDDIITVRSYIFTKSLRRNTQQLKNTEIDMLLQLDFLKGKSLPAIS